MILQIISGGQTGADRAGLDVALELGLNHGGYCPKGRIAEDGVIPAQYKLIETSSSQYPVRTSLNVQHSDGTVVFTYGLPGRGSSRTLVEIRRHKKPGLHIDLNHDFNTNLTKLVGWVIENKIEVLNVAGSRGSSALKLKQNISEDIKKLLMTAIGVLNE